MHCSVLLMVLKARAKPNWQPKQVSTTVCCLVSGAVLYAKTTRESYRFRCQHTAYETRYPNGRLATTGCDRSNRKYQSAMLPGYQRSNLRQRLHKGHRSRTFSPRPRTSISRSCRRQIFNDQRETMSLNRTVTCGSPAQRIEWEPTSTQRLHVPI